ncbi:protein EFR B [Canna indica]|uniref:Protein EFR B n=1 Tax=Canna indica TaxID=4628 RepID=A0AAQ3KBX4_9LILI|nr:protein EFR B [Canna indica]
MGDDMAKWNERLQKAIDECLTQLSKKVGDSGPLFDIMTMMLENISATVSVARSTISTVYHMARMIVSLPNISYQNKESTCFRLSNQQIMLMFSSIWAQAMSPENTPENEEAIAHTFSLILLFSGDKQSKPIYVE